jgi:hypothetical protein
MQRGACTMKRNRHDIDSRRPESRHGIAWPFRKQNSHRNTMALQFAREEERLIMWSAIDRVVNDEENVQLAPLSGWVELIARAVSTECSDRRHGKDPLNRILEFFSPKFWGSAGRHHLRGLTHTTP